MGGGGVKAANGEEWFRFSPPLPLYLVYELKGLANLSFHFKILCTLAVETFRFFLRLESFCSDNYRDFSCSFFFSSRDVLDEISDLTESVSDGFPTYF